MKAILAILAVAMFFATACSETAGPEGQIMDDYGNQRENVKIPEKDGYEKVVINPVFFLDSIF